MTLRIVAQGLYGPTWQAELSRALGADRRTVRRWHSGEYQVPDAVWEQLAQAYMVHVGRALEVMGSIGATGAVRLAVYPTTKDLERVTGDGWSAEFHRRVMRHVAERTEARLVLVDADDYFAWLGDRENTTARRSQYVAEADLGLFEAKILT